MEGRQARALRRVEVVVARRGARLEGERELVARLVDVAEPELREPEPEVELMVFGRAARFLAEQIACALEVARLHGGETGGEIVERRVAFDARELPVDGSGVGIAPEPAEREREVGE